MSLIDTVADRIAEVRGHDRSKCNERCQCYPLALEIVGMVERAHYEDRNQISEKLMDRTDQLTRLRRFMGVEE